jgi:hypothetical protein
MMEVFIRRLCGGGMNGPVSNIAAFSISPSIMLADHAMKPSMSYCAQYSPYAPHVSIELFESREQCGLHTLSNQTHSAPSCTLLSGSPRRVLSLDCTSPCNRNSRCWRSDPPVLLHVSQATNRHSASMPPTQMTYNVSWPMLKVLSHVVACSATDQKSSPYLSRASVG